jgi:hypothetical protein
LQPTRIALALIFAERSLVVKCIDLTRTTLHEEEYDTLCTRPEMSAWGSSCESRLTGGLVRKHLLSIKTITTQKVDQGNRRKATAELPEKFTTCSSTRGAIGCELSRGEVHQRLLLLKIVCVVYATDA